MYLIESLPALNVDKGMELLALALASEDDGFAFSEAELVSEL